MGRIQDKLRQRVTGKIPPWQRVLETATTVGKEIGEFPRGFAEIYTLGLEPRARSLGQKAAEALVPGHTPPGIFDEREPETSGVGRRVLPSILMGMAAGKGIAKAGTKLFGLKGRIKEVRGIEDIIPTLQKFKGTLSQETGQIKRVGKILKERTARASEKLGFQAKEKIPTEVDKLFKESGKVFEKGLGKLQSTLADEDLANILTKAAREHGAELIEGTPGHGLMQLDRKFGLKAQPEEGVIQTVVKKYSPTEVQALVKRITGSLPTSRSKAIFYKHLLDQIQSSVPGLAELKSAYAPIYNVAKQAAKVTKGAVKRTVSGVKKISPAEVSALEAAEKPLGTQFVQKAKGLREKNRIQELALKQRQSKIGKKMDATERQLESLKKRKLDLAREIQDVTRRRKAVGFTVGTLGAL